MPFQKLLKQKALLERGLLIQGLFQRDHDSVVALGSDAERIYREAHASVTDSMISNLEQYQKLKRGIAELKSIEKQLDDLTIKYTKPSRNLRTLYDIFVSGVEDGEIISTGSAAAVRKECRQQIIRDEGKPTRLEQERSMEHAELTTLDEKTMHLLKQFSQLLCTCQEKSQKYIIRYLAGQNYHAFLEQTLERVEAEIERVEAEIRAAKSS